MSSTIHSGLAWLPRPPADFAAQCRAALAADADPGRRIQWLAAHALDEGQLDRLARVVTGARQAGRSLAPLTGFRLAMISNATTSLIAPALIATAARYGIALDCVEADFGQVLQEAVSADSATHRAKPDAVLVALDFRGLPIKATPGDRQAADATVAAALDHLATIRAGIRRNGNAICILQTLARPAESTFGNLDAVVPGTQRALIDAINRGIADSIPGTEDLLLDVAGLAETVGLDSWHDATLWNIAKLPFGNEFVPLYAEHVCRLIAALRGRSRRCLILDLDNTVWNGVIGDDGLEGIVIGQGDPTGEAHLAVQQAALALRDRGIVLAVSSKNNDETARLPFRNHPEMALRESHIAVFQANWNDKATNIKAIAEALSLGLESMVFLDDNPVERGLIREILPAVAVPELPDDPALYARTLLAAGYFESVSFSDEDRKRAAMYQDNARRVALQSQAGGVEGYLAALAMVITFQPFDPVGRARIAQLINKSNQFNLTTRRYTEAEVAAAERDPDCFTLQVRLADSFGDNGMISVVICRRRAQDWDIDTWLMSCRVLGRRVEEAVLQEILREARRRGVRRLTGRYIPTARNSLVEDHYAKLGFEAVERQDDGTTVWRLEVAAAPTLTLPMEVRRPQPEMAGV
jgi:FkbH-like protein